MKTTLIIGLLLLLSSVTQCFASTPISNSEMFDGTVYSFSVEDGQIANSPSWDDKSSCPPLAPWEAAQKAREFVAKIPAREDFEWDLSSISIHQFGKLPERWIYKVQFHESTKRSYDGFIQRFEVIVLMDGTVPQMTVRR